MFCKELLHWPEDVLKILHVVFCGFAFIMLCVAVSEPLEPYPNYIRYPGYFDSRLETKAGYIQAVRAHWAFILWFLLIIVPLVCGIVLLVMFLIRDPRKEKKGLLIYYASAAGICLLCTIISIFYFIHVGKFRYCVLYWSSGLGRDPFNKKECKLGSTGFFWALFFAFIFSLAGCGSYLTSAFYNYKLKKP